MIPCEHCMGTGKREFYFDEKQPSLPISIAIEGKRRFISCDIEADDEDNHFLLNIKSRGTFAELEEKENKFYDWIRSNYPKEVFSSIVIVIERLE